MQGAESLLNGFGLPIDISTHGYQIDNLIYIMHGVMALLFIGWCSFFLYCVIRFRKRDGHSARYDLSYGKFSKYVEVGIIIVEAVLLVGFSMPIFASLKHDFPAKEEALEVRIVAEQFAWNVHYPGRDRVFGRQAPDLISASNPVGLDQEDRYGKDDIVSVNNLYIPVDRPVIVYLSSKDVIHSFFIPVMRVKQDTTPGMQIPIWFKATRTGSFDIACAQLCGIGHYRMKGQIVIQEPAAFEEWVKTKEKERETQS